MIDQGMLAGFRRSCRAEGTEAIASDMLSPLRRPGPGASRRPALSALAQEASASDEERDEQAKHFSGALRYTQEHSLWLHTCKRRRCAERKVEADKAAGESVRQAWNAERLRHGDHIGELKNALEPAHPSSWSVRQVTVSA